MPLGDVNKLGIMPGAMDGPDCFGVKLISLYPDNPASGHSSHLGLMVLFGEWVQAGSHVNAVGASVPTMREIDEDLLAKSSLFVDYRPSAFAQAGDVIAALKSGAISDNHIIGEIDEVLAQKVRGHQNSNEITLYRSLGIAAQDLICAFHVMTQAKANGIGINASIS